jgi:hypothetical protein
VVYPVRNTNPYLLCTVDSIFPLGVLVTQPSASLARNAIFFFVRNYMKESDRLQAPAALLPTEEPSLPIEYGRALEPDYMSW